MIDEPTDVIIAIARAVLRFSNDSISGYLRVMTTNKLVIEKYAESCSLIRKQWRRLAQECEDPFAYLARVALLLRIERSLLINIFNSSK